MSSKKLWGNVLIIGDSLTQRGFSPGGKWVAMLADHLSGRCDVINRGFSGYNTRMVGHFLLGGGAEIVSADQAERNLATLVFLGANDSVQPGQMQHVPIEEYQDNLCKMLHFLESERGIPKKNLWLVPPPPCDEATWQRFAEERDGSKLDGPPKTKQLTKTYHEACKRTAQENGYRWITGLWDALDDGSMFCDGLHFSDKGSDTLAALVIDQLNLSDLPFVLPYWKEVLTEGVPPLK